MFLRGNSVLELERGCGMQGAVSGREVVVGRPPHSPLGPSQGPLRGWRGHQGGVLTTPRGLSVRDPVRQAAALGHFPAGAPGLREAHVFPHLLYLEWHRGGKSHVGCGNPKL